MRENYLRKNEQYVCYECIHDSYLSLKIRGDSNSFECDFCGELQPCISISDLGERVHEVIQTHYRQTSPDPEGMDYLLQKEGLWEQPGEPVIDIIEDLTSSSLEVANSVLEYLDSYNAQGKHALVDLQPYFDDSLYEEAPLDTKGFHQTWINFRDEIISNARYFNDSARDCLKEIFGDISVFDIQSERSPICTITTSDKVYRARVARDLREAGDILERLPLSMGAPPENASAGRMNAAGIGVFYGAFDTQTCVREVRPAVGAWIVMASFLPTRDLTFLNLGLLEQFVHSANGSLFDKDYVRSLERMAFLRQLVKELAAPVLPGDETISYLPTQAITEFLSGQSDVRLDGVIYPSSQAARIDVGYTADGEGARTLKGNNVMLFRKTSGEVVSEPEIPYPVEFDMWSYGGSETDELDDVEFYLSRAKHKETDSVFHTGDFAKNESCMRLQLENIKLMQIKSTRYSSLSHSLNINLSPDDGDKYDF